MAEEATTTDAATTEADAATTTETEEQRVPYERFQQANKKAKEAADRAKALERDLAALREQVNEREQAGLPELDQLKKRLEQAEKRAEDADQRATQFEAQASNAQRERWIEKAAASLNFIDPDDATRYVDLTDIESAEDAERAVKKVAKAKQHLLKGDEPTLPGRVLENGQPTTAGKPGQSNIDLSSEAQMLARELQKFASPK